MNSRANSWGNFGHEPEGGLIRTEVTLLEPRRWAFELRLRDHRCGHEPGKGRSAPRTSGDRGLGGHPDPASRGHLKSGQSQMPPARTGVKGVRPAAVASRPLTPLLAVGEGLSREGSAFPLTRAGLEHSAMRSAKHWPDRTRPRLAGCEGSTEDRGDTSSDLSSI